MTNNESITPHTTERLICDIARKQSTSLNSDGSPSWAYQVGYLSSVVKQLLGMLTEEQLRAVHEEFQRLVK
jgi:hypothetical protein